MKSSGIGSREKKGPTTTDAILGASSLVVNGQPVRHRWALPTIKHDPIDLLVDT